MTYQNPTKLRSTLKQYIDKVAEFKGDRIKDEVIKQSEIKSRYLELAIPNKGSTTQQQIVKETLEYAKQKNVKLKIIQVE